MSNVIDFLEQVGQNAQLREAARSDIAMALRSSQLDPALRTAILESTDRRQLEIACGASTNVCCGLLPVEDVYAAN